MGAREDSWPLENVSKVSVITGEFNGHSVSGLIHYCWTYFFITMGFDLLQAFVVENIQVSHARSLSLSLSHVRAPSARNIRGGARGEEHGCPLQHAGGRSR